MSDLARLLMGFRVSQAVLVAADLGIPERLLEGPRSSGELAAEVGADADALYRLLRALARVGVFDELDGRCFALTQLGRDLAGPFRAQAVFYARSTQWEVWSDLGHSVRTGESAFEHLYGEPVWEWRTKHPEESSLFDDWMTAMTLASTSAIVAGLDWGRYAHVVDVAGGHGALLRAILDANPETRGTLFDQEHVVAAAPPHERIDVVAGSFFERVPAGGDVYVLKSIVHDWPDDEAVAILRMVAAALEGDARVVLLERDMTDDTAPWIDLQMLLMFAARERTEAEYNELFRAAGLEPVGVTPVGAGYAAFEARLQ